MRFEEFVMGRWEYHKAHPEQREGQSHMNYLFYVHRDLYDKISKYRPDADCFYDDSKLGTFLSVVAVHWNKKSHDYFPGPPTPC
jgi:hypothetical protein